jgi:hypothetical protein
MLNDKDIETIRAIAKANMTDTFYHNDTHDVVSVYDDGYVDGQIAMARLVCRMLNIDYGSD